MTAAHDFVVGDSPQIDPQLCKDRRIGIDRVWRVAVVMLTHAKPDSDFRMFMSRSYLASQTHMNERDVRDAVAVLEDSGVIARQGFIVTPLGTKNPSVDWRPGWQPSGKKLKVNFADIEVDAQVCRETGVGRDRAWRVAYLAKVLKNATPEVLAQVSGIAVRQVRKALQALGTRLVSAATKAVEWALRPDPRHDSVTTHNNPPSQPPSGVVQERTHARARGTRGKSWWKWLTGGNTMPWEIFKNDDRVPDDDFVTSKTLSAEARKRAKNTKLPRYQRPVETWSPLDSAKEFRERYEARYPMAPGATGDVVQIAKILGSMRKKYQHDARTEMIILDLWLDDTTDVIRKNASVDAWRKWIQAFGRYYDEAEKRVGRRDKDYHDYEARYNAKMKPKREAARKARIERSNARFEEMLRRQQKKREQRES